MAQISARAKSRNEPSQATEVLIRRILCPQTHGNLSNAQTPLETLLPPLTSSNAVDLQLYAIIAVVMRDFVYSWYGKITPDQTFVEDSIRIVAHCTRELEQRLRKVDLELLLLHEIPNIIKVHIDAFRIAYSKGTAMPESGDPEILYHALCPHAALSPAPEHGLSTVEQIQNEAAYRQLLIQGVLAVLLPTEDLQNPCLRILVADIIADMILGNGVGAKASAGWVLWEGIAKILEQQKQQRQQFLDDATYQSGKKSERKSNIVTQLTTERKLDSSGADGKAATSVEPILQVNGLSIMFWRILQYLYLLILGTRFLIIGLWRASGKQVIDENSGGIPVAGKDRYTPMTSRLEALSYGAKSKRSFLTYSVFEVLSLLLELYRRMPWLLGWTSLIRHHLVDGLLQVGSTGGILDKSLHNTFQQQVLRPELLPLALQAIRNAIFPNDALAPARATPLAHEQRLIKRRAAIAILNTIPNIVASQYLSTAPTNASNGSSGGEPLFASTTTINTNAVAAATPSSSPLADPSTSNNNPAQARFPSPSQRQHHYSLPKADNQAPKPAEEQEDQPYRIPDPDPRREAQLLDIESALDVFGNQYMNKHMLYSLIELLVVRFVPEIRFKSAKVLLDERLGREVSAS